jgi:hypothetical protein
LSDDKAVQQIIGKGEDFDGRHKWFRHVSQVDHPFMAIGALWTAKPCKKEVPACFNLTTKLRINII